MSVFKRSAEQYLGIESDLTNTTINATSTSITGDLTVSGTIFSGVTGLHGVQGFQGSQGFLGNQGVQGVAGGATGNFDVGGNLTVSGSLGVTGNVSFYNGVVFRGIYFITRLEDLPTAVGGVISLLPDTSYYFTTVVDLLGARLVCDANTMLEGSSSEISWIKSTGLTGGALITSNYSLPMQNITINSGSAQAFDLEALIPGQALDWVLVNLNECAIIGTIKSYNNFLYTEGAFIDSAAITFDGTISTIAFNTSLFTGLAGKSTIILASTLVVSRRFRIIYSSFVVPSTAIGIEVNALTSIPTESYILDTVNFSGGGTYLSGFDYTSNLALFINNKGITNTSANGQMYLTASATTVISDTTTFVKVAGTTSPSSENSKFDSTNNRLTCTAIISRRYLVQVSLSLTSGNNNVIEVGMFDSTINAVRTPSRIKTTTSGTGRSESVTTFCVVNFQANDYLEIYLRNTSSITNVTVDSLNVVMTQI